jgi:hypothetical protein
MAPHEESVDSTTTADVKCNTATKRHKPILKTPTGFVGRVKNMFGMSQIVKEVNPGFGHTIANSVVTRGRRVESVDDAKRFDKQMNDGLRLKESAKRAEYEVKIEKVEKTNETLTEKAARINEEKIREKLGSREFTRRPKSPSKGIVSKAIDYITGSSSDNDPATAKGHDVIVRNKLMNSHKSGLSRRLYGYINGIDTKMRETDPEYLELQKKQQLINEQIQADRIAKGKWLQQQEKEERRLARKSTYFQKAIKVTRNFFGFNSNISRSNADVAVYGDVNSSTPPKERLNSNKKQLLLQQEEYKQLRFDVDKNYEYNMEILGQVKNAYTHIPLLDKKLKIHPPHSYQSKHMKDYDEHYLHHNNNNNNQYSANDMAIEGVPELIEQRPDLFMNTNTDSEGVGADDDDKSKQGYDYDAYFNRKRAGQAKHARNKHREILGEDVESVTNSSIAAAESGGNVICSDSHQIQIQKVQKVNKIKEKQMLIEEKYKNHHMPRKWWKEGMCQPNPCAPDDSEEEVTNRLNHLDYIPAHLHQYRGEDKIFSFPPVADQAGLVETFDVKIKKKLLATDDFFPYDFTPGVDNNEETNCSNRYKWDDVTQSYYIPENYTFKTNNSRLECYKPPTTDVLDNFLYKHRKSAKRIYPQTKLLPSKKDLLELEEKNNAVQYKENRPIIRFKKSAVDFSRNFIRLNNTDPITIKNAKNRLFKKLKKGIIDRVTYDKFLAKLHDEGYNDKKSTKPYADNYGDYHDDACEFVEDNDNDNDNDDNVSVHSGVTEDDGGGLENNIGLASMTSPEGAGDSITSSGKSGRINLSGSMVSRRTTSSKSKTSTSTSKNSNNNMDKGTTTTKVGAVPVIISNIMGDIIPINILTTMGQGGKYSDLTYKEKTIQNIKIENHEITNRPNRGIPKRPPPPEKDPIAEGATPEIEHIDNKFYLNHIDQKFNTEKFQLIKNATLANHNLSDGEVKDVGDLYHNETRTMVAQRQLLEENSLPSSKQQIKIKFQKHRGALGLDKKHISKSHQKTYKFNLESAKTKSKRFDKLQVKRNLKRSVKEVDKLMKDMTDADNEAAEERRRERNRLGLE